MTKVLQPWQNPWVVAIKSTKRLFPHLNLNRNPWNQILLRNNCINLKKDKFWIDICNWLSRESDSVDSDKDSSKGMIFFQVELLRLRDLVRAVFIITSWRPLWIFFLKKYFNSNGSIRVIQIHVIEIRIIKNSCYVRT